MKFDNKKFTVYIAFAFIIGWALQVVASIFAIKGQMMLFAPVLSVTMFAPLAAAFIAKADLKSLGWKPQIKKNIKMYIVCWFVPAVITVFGAVLFYAVMPDRLDLSGGYIEAQIGEAVVQQMADMGITPVMYLVIGFVQSITYAPIVNAFFAIGEEAGWRGVMYPMLKNKYGTNKGRVIGGAIWGAWHWPVMVLAGYEYGLVYWGAPIVGMVLFCFCCVVLGTVMDWTYEKTASIWAPALAHGAFNAVGTLPVMLLNTEYADQMILGPAPIGIIAMIPMIVFSFMISRKAK